MSNESIGFEQPTRKIDKYVDENIVHLYGQKSFGVLLTADHKVMGRDRGGKYSLYDAIDFPMGNNGEPSVFVPQSGYYHNVCDISLDKLVFLAAYQADGYLKSTKYRHVAFKFSKERKIERLESTLIALDIPYTKKVTQYEGDRVPFTWFLLDLPEWVDEYVFLSKDKTFTRNILTLPVEMLYEIRFWDGHAANYSSTNLTNVELMQELCVYRGIAANICVAKGSSWSKKQGYMLRMHKLSGTHTKTQTKNIVDYSGRVVCFEMPHSTLIIRRKGKIMCIGNCGQELRVTAHYAEGNILSAYQANPKLDVHTWVQKFILDATGISLNRVVTKTISFLKLYGGGPGKLAVMLNISDEEARQFFAAYDAALPEFKQLMKDIETVSRRGQKIRTWGGRLYDVEPAIHVNGRRKEFYYKLGNILIQGSSADMTKEAMVRYHNHPERTGRIMLVVHDEIVCSCPEDKLDHELKVLKESMDDILGWDVPLRSEGKYGPNFGEMQAYDD